MAKALVTPVGTLSYPHFFKPRPKAKDSVDLVYSGSLLFTATATKTDQWKALVAAVEDLAKTSFPKGTLGKSLKSPFLDPANYDNVPEDYEVFIRAWTNEKPGIIDAAKNDVFDSGEVWPGQWARFSVAPFAYENAGNKGVSFYLHNVQIVKSAGLKRLDGRKSAVETFDDEFAGADDEI